MALLSLHTCAQLLLGCIMYFAVPVLMRSSLHYCARLLVQRSFTVAMLRCCRLTLGTAGRAPSSSDSTTPAATAPARSPHIVPAELRAWQPGSAAQRRC